jgi:hypothetical protein
MPLVFTPSATPFQRWLPNWMRWPSQKSCLGLYLEPANHLPMQTINPVVPAMPEQNPAIQLDSEEQALLSDYDAGTWSSVATPGVLQSLREAARATGHPGSSLNLDGAHRLSP